MPSFDPNGNPAYQGTIGASPWATGAAGNAPKYSPWAIALWNQQGAASGFNLNTNTYNRTWGNRTGTVQQLAGGFTPPDLQRTNLVSATLLARRKLAGMSGVGSTFLTGSSGVKPSSQTLGYSGLLGQ